MSDLPNKVVLTSGTKYGEAKALIAAAWPRLSVQKGRGMRHLALTPSEEIHATFRYLRSCCHWPLMAADPVTVKGTSVTYPPAVSANVKDKDVQLSLTGVGLRTKVGFNVYTVASYLQDGTRVQKAEDLARTDAVRLLHLVMQRTVQPDAFIGAFRTAVGKSYPDDKFVGEFTQLVNAIGKNAADKGDNVTLLYVPGEGMRVQVSNKVDVTIKSPAFAQALWEVYLGAKPLDEGLKKRTGRPSRPVTWARGETSRGPYRRRDSGYTWSWKRLWARTPRFSHGDWITVSWSAGSKPRH